MSLTLTTSDTGEILGVFLDGLPKGSPADFLAAHPKHAPDFLAAVAAHHAARHATSLLGLTTQLQAAQAALDQMRAKYEPPPAPANLLVIELPAPIGQADHAGITGIVKGVWQADLLRRTGDNQYALVKEDGLQFPADAKVSSLTEVSAAQVAKDLLASVSPNENAGQALAG